MSSLPVLDPHDLACRRNVEEGTDGMHRAQVRYVFISAFPCNGPKLLAVSQITSAIKVNPRIVNRPMRAVPLRQCATWAAVGRTHHNLSVGPLLSCYA
jgi:hypothetical protein